jgi:class 3 adenylate cyclase
VNLASRLEGLTKVPEYETKIVISGSTLTKVTNKFQVRRLGEVAVRGKKTATEIFALLGRATPAER